MILYLMDYSKIYGKTLKEQNMQEHIRRGEKGSIKTVLFGTIVPDVGGWGQVDPNF